MVKGSGDRVIPLRAGSGDRENCSLLTRSLIIQGSGHAEIGRTLRCSPDLPMTRSPDLQFTRSPDDPISRSANTTKGPSRLCSRPPLLPGPPCLGPRQRPSAARLCCSSTRLGLSCRRLRHLPWLPQQRLRSSQLPRWSPGAVLWQRIEWLLLVRTERTTPGQLQRLKLRRFVIALLTSTLTCPCIVTGSHFGPVPRRLQFPLRLFDA